MPGLVWTFRFRTATQTMPLRSLIVPIAILSMIGSSCSGSDLTRSKVKTLLEAKPTSVQWSVQLSKPQFECGVKAGLWESSRGLVAVTKTGETLKFLGVVGEPGPTENTRVTDARLVQIFGDVAVAVDEVTSINVELDHGTKWTEVKLGAKIPHACFASPLPFVIPDSQGKNQAPGPIKIGFKQDDNGWRLDGDRRWHFTTQ